MCNDADVDLNELVSSIFADEEPDWFEDGESTGFFESSSYWIGTIELSQWCSEKTDNAEAASKLEDDIQQLLCDNVDGQGMTDSVWIEEA